MKIFSVEGCGRKHTAHGLCDAHWQRVRNGFGLHPELPITKSKPGKLNSRWKGGKMSDPNGRVLVYSPGHPNPTTLGIYVYRYRLVMEEKLGRYLTPDEIVHHINGIVNDDRPDNLEVMTQSLHAKLHAPAMVEAIKNKWQGRWSKNFACCVQCGSSDRKHQGLGLCSRCYRKQYKSKI